MTGTETLIRDLTEPADMAARHSLWIDQGRCDETDRLFTEDVVVNTLRGQARGIEALVDPVRSRHDQ